MDNLCSTNRCFSLLPVVVIKNRDLEDNVMFLIRNISKKWGKEIIRIVRLKERELVVAGDRACFPSNDFRDVILSNPAIYVTYEDFDDAIIVNDENDLKKLEGELAVRLRTATAYSALPKLNCGKCGYKNCYELASLIAEGKEDFSSCPVLSLAKRTRITVNGKKIFLTPWVEKLFRSLILTFLSNLKGVEISGDEEIILEVKK